MITILSSSDILRDWQKIRLKRIANLNPSKKEVVSLPGDTKVTFLPMEVVSESWEVDYSQIRPLEEVCNGYTYFRNGDILLAKITPCFENGKGALVNNCINGVGFGSTEFHVIRSPDSDTTRFLSYVVRSHRFKVEGEGMMTGTAGQKRVSDDYVKNFEVFLPPKKLRGAIASFLDRKTVAIDTLITKKQRLIQLLEEKRTALINQAVTKGLNPNVPMKDSRIPWIGYIPEHWKAIQIRRYIRRIEQGWSPVAEDRIAQGNEWAVLKLNSVSKGEFHPNEYKVLSEDTEPDKRFEVKHGDLLLSRANTPQLVGEVCYVRNPPRRLMLCDLLYRLDINERLLNKRFCTYYLFSKSGKAQISADARGTSQSMVKISQGHIKTWIIPLPPSLEEQESIANYLDGQLAYIKNITHRIIQQIEKLQEYRQSLITAAVTGKIDIREEVAA
ncbi:MAG: restriction endonuclease subunit S [Nostoc sp.]